MSLPLVLAFVLMPPLAQEAAQAALDLSGHWEGSIALAGLDFDIDFTRDEGGLLVGDLSIPVQSLRDLELLDLTLEGSTLAFALPDEIPGDARFEGTVDASGASASGTFHQGGARLSFTMERAEDPFLAAQAALEGFDDWMADVLKDFRVPGATVAVVLDGRVLLAEGYGMRNAETEAPATADTVFAIGSTTKAFTTFAIAQAVERGELEWEAPVRRVLPELDLVSDYAESQITLRDMVTHVSGLPRHDLSWYLFPDKSRAELVASLAHHEPSAELRETWQYNNVMYLTAGVALERVTGRTWEENVREGILDPLGMDATVFGPRAAAASPDHAVAHERRKGKSVVIPFRDITNIGPAGSIHASASDMAQWLRCLLGGGTVDDLVLLGQASFAPLVIPTAVLPQLTPAREASPLGYARGWMVDNHRGHLRVHHGGGIDGFVTQVELFPGDMLGIFVSCNRASGLPNAVASRVQELVLGLEEQGAAEAAASQQESVQQFDSVGEEGAAAARIENAPPAHELSAYVGDYLHEGYGTARITLVDGALQVELGSMADTLEPWHYEVFRTTEADEERSVGRLLFQFETDLAGYVTALRAPLEPMVDPIRFERTADAGLTDPAFLARLTGNYRLANQEVEVRVESGRLVVEVSGQPPYTLEPWTHNRFRLAEMEGFSVRFREAEGEIGSLLFYQPNGTFVAERIRPDGGE